MANQIYKKDEYIICPTHKGLVVINTNMRRREKSGHTHTGNMYRAKRLIHLALTNTMPAQDEGLRMVKSLARITKGDFAKRCRQVYNSRKSKGKKQEYYNVPQM